MERFAIALATIDDPGPNEIYLYYNGPPVARGGARAWSQAYAGVWHMSQTTLIELDSTTHGNHVVAGSLAMSPGSAVGIAGNGRSFDGLGQQLCTVGASDGSLDFALMSVAMSVWVNVPSSAGTWDAPIYRGGGSTNDPGIALELGTGEWRATILDTANVPLLMAITNETLGTWVHLALVVDRPAMKVRGYLNGIVVIEVPLGNIASLTAVSRLCIGSESNGNYFKGTIDEARVYAEVSTDEVRAIDNAISTEYANLAHRSSFITIGPQELLP